MSFLLGGLRFQEQVGGPALITWAILTTSDLQQHCYSNERLSSELECHELAFTGMYCHRVQ